MLKLLWALVLFAFAFFIAPTTAACSQPHEVWNPCAPNCPPQTCESIGKVYPCPLQSAAYCRGACRCENGYYRNHIGECISEEECLQCPGEHEYFSCRGACDNVCATLSEQNQTNCPIVNIQCNNMCYCEEDYARDDSNVCVPISQCPGSSRRKRSSDGNLVSMCNGQNEYYASCPPICPPQTCESIGKSYSCPAMTDDPDNCHPACRCLQGYFRNTIGECISEADCLECPGDHEYYSCGGACDNVCATLQEQNQTSCPIVNKACNKMCYCEQDYARDENNRCIPIDQCPSDNCPGANQYYDLCPPNCPPQTCESLGNTYFCPAILKDNCKPACRCIDGYYRNENGECISEEDCEN